MEKIEANLKTLSDEVIENRTTMKLMQNLSTKATWLGVALIVLAGAVIVKIAQG